MGALRLPISLLGHRWPIEPVLHQWSPNGSIILYYHGVCDDSFALLDSYDQRHVRTSQFKWQLEYLVEHKYHFVTLSELISASDRIREHERLAVLTFDDGFANVINNAYPVIKELGAKGCMFVIPGLIDSDALLWTDVIDIVVWAYLGRQLTIEIAGKIHAFDLANRKLGIDSIRCIKKLLRAVIDDERVEALREFDRILKELPSSKIPAEFQIVRWQQLASVDKNVLEVGSHTMSHPNLLRMNTRALEYELSMSKKRLEDALGYRVSHFCYPGGAFDERVKAQVMKADYHSAATTKHGFATAGTDRYELPRIECVNDPGLFVSSVTGWTGRYLSVKSYFFNAK